MSFASHRSYTDEAIELCRQELRQNTLYQFWEAEGYRDLLVSSRRLIRADIPRAALRGLHDPHTGEFFVIEEEKLFG